MGGYDRVSPNQRARVLLKPREINPGGQSQKSQQPNLATRINETQFMEPTRALPLRSTILNPSTRHSNHLNKVRSDVPNHIDETMVVWDPQTKG